MTASAVPARRRPTLTAEFLTVVCPTRRELRTFVRQELVGALARMVASAAAGQPGVAGRGRVRVALRDAAVYRRVAGQDVSRRLVRAVATLAARPGSRVAHRRAQVLLARELDRLARGAL